MSRIIALFIAFLLTASCCYAETPSPILYTEISLEDVQYSIPDSWVYEYSDEFTMNYHYETGNAYTGGLLITSCYTFEDLQYINLLDDEAIADIHEAYISGIVDGLVENSYVELDIEPPQLVDCYPISLAGIMEALAGDFDPDPYTYFFCFVHGNNTYNFAYSNPTQTNSDALSEFEEILSTITINDSIDESESASSENQGAEVDAYVYSFSDSYYLSLAITNKTGKDVSIDVAVKYFDESGGLVGVSNASEPAFGDGAQILVTVSNDLPFAKYEYEITAKDDPYYECVNDDLETEITIVAGKAIVGVTNTSSVPARFVEYQVLFMNNGSVVDRERGYATDSDSEIKPGKTQYFEEKSSEPFDDVLVFVNGYGYK